MMEFSGVQHVTTGHALAVGEWNEGTVKFRQGTHHLKQGDLIIELQPGWKVNLDNPERKGVKKYAIMLLSPRWYLWATVSNPQHIYREVKVLKIRIR